MIAVHGRTRNQFYTGQADWAAIAPVVDAVNIPVIANGDIGSAADARRALALSGAAGIMIGRAAQGRPWFPPQSNAHSNTAARPRRHHARGCWRHCSHSTKTLSPSTIMASVSASRRKHIAWTIDAALGPATREKRKTICTLMDPQRVRADLCALFEDEPELVAA